MVACRKPSAWNIGAGSDVTSLALNGTCDSTPPIGASDGGVLRLAPLGVPVVPLVRMMIELCLVTFGAGLLLLRCDEIGERLVRTTRRLVLVGIGGECAQFALRRFGLRNGLGVLVVVDDDRGALALGHLFDLGPGELAVEQDDAGAGPGRAVDGDQEPAVVARENRHSVPALDPHRQQAIGDGMRGVVQLFEGELAVVVDDGRPIGRPARVQRRDHAELTPAPDIGDERGDVLRWLELQRARLEHLAGVVQLGCAAFGVLLDFGRCLQGQIG